MLQLYEGSTSVCAIKVRLVLFEKTISFKSCPIDLRVGEQFDPDYLKLNPKGVVPTLVDNGTPVVESSVIMQYLEDKHPLPSLLPIEATNRKRMRRLIRCIDDEVHPSTGNITHATVYRPSFLSLHASAQAARLAKIPDENRRRRRAAVYMDGLEAPIVVDAIKRFDKLISDMETALTLGDYLAGSAYSLADAAVTPYINRLSDLGLLTLWADGAPRTLSWFDAIRKRDSFAQAVIDYMTEADKKAFEGIDPETPMRIRRILNGL